MQRNIGTILRELDPRSRVIGLVVLLAEALFLGSLAKLPAAQVIWALLVCAVVLLAGLAAVVKIETSATSAPREKSETPVSKAVEIMKHPRDFYERIAPFYDERNTKYLLETHRAVIAEVSKVADGGQCTDVLDVGCGTGRLIAAHVFEHQSLHWVGVDCAPGMLDQFRRNLEGTELDSEPVLGDIFELGQFVGREFDLILISLVLTSLAELPNFQGIAALVRPKGRLVLADIDPVYSEVNPVFAVKIGDDQLGIKVVPRHPLDIIDLLTRAGLKLLDTQTIRRGDGVRYAYVLVAERSLV